MASGNSGSTTTGISSASVDLSTAAATNTFPLRIVGIEDDPANADYSAVGHQYIVRLNGHFNSGTTIAVGTYATTGI